MCWGSHILFQSPNGAHVLWPTLSRRFFFFFSRAQMNFRRSWNRINLSRPMNNKGMKMLGLVVWEQRMRRPLWEIHLWSCSDALNANYETQKRSETKRHATDSAIHHAMLFDLKRLFFSLIILRSSEPFSHRRKYIAISQSPPPASQGGQRSGVQCLARRHFRRRETFHMKDGFPRPPFCLFFFFLPWQSIWSLKGISH